MIRIILLACVLLASSWAVASDEPTPSADSMLQFEVARWMTEQSDPEMRATGLSALAGAGTVEPERFMGEVQSLLDEDPTGAAVFMLARGCQALELLESCAEAGLPAAIDRLDGGNPLAAAFFHDPDSANFRQVLMSAESIDDYYPAVVSAWFEAFHARDTDSLEEGAELLSAISIAMATVVRLSDVVTRCRDAVGSDEALDAACHGLSQQMRRSARTLILRNIGFGMARARAEAIGQDEQAEALHEQRDALFKRQMCVIRAAEPALIDGGEELQRQFLEVFEARGEMAAFELVAGDAAAECPGA